MQHQSNEHISWLLPKPGASRRCREHVGSNEPTGRQKGRGQTKRIAHGIPWVFPTSLVSQLAFSISTSKAWRKKNEIKPPEVGFDSFYF